MRITEIDDAIDMLDFYKSYIKGEIKGNMLLGFESKIKRCIKKLSKLYKKPFLVKVKE